MISPDPCLIFGDTVDCHMNEIDDRQAEDEEVDEIEKMLEELGFKYS